MQAAGQGVVVFLIAMIVFIVVAVVIFAFQVVKLTKQIKKTVDSSNQAANNIKLAVRYAQAMKAPALVVIGIAKKKILEARKAKKDDPGKEK